MRAAEGGAGHRGPGRDEAGTGARGRVTEARPGFQGGRLRPARLSGRGRVRRGRRAGKGTRVRRLPEVSLGPGCLCLCWASGRRRRQRRGRGPPRPAAHTSSAPLSLCTHRPWTHTWAAPTVTRANPARLPCARELIAREHARARTPRSSDYQGSRTSDNLVQLPHRTGKLRPRRRRDFLKSHNRMVWADLNPLHKHTHARARAPTQSSRQSLVLSRTHAGLFLPGNSQETPRKRQAAELPRN